jgi:hypothetical protein
MIRNLKVLGLALVAVFAMSAIAASAASAQNGRITSTGPVTLDATEITTEVNALTAFGGEVKCPGSTITGHEVGSTTKGVPSGAETATLTPDYNQAACVAVFSGTTHKATVTMNGCDYVLHAGTTTGVADTYSATVDVVCPAGASIIVDAYFAASNENLKICEITVGPQTGLAGPTIKDTTTGDLEVHGTFTGIHASQTGAGCIGGSTTTTGQFHANLTVKGTNGAKENTAISLSHA